MNLFRHSRLPHATRGALRLVLALSTSALVLHTVPACAATFVDACQEHPGNAPSVWGTGLVSDCSRFPLWRDGVVYYEWVDNPNHKPPITWTDPKSQGAQRSEVRTAMDKWEEKTNGFIRFVNDPSAATRIRISGYGKESIACYGNFNQGTAYDVSFFGCGQAVIEHELGHVLGLPHHHQRDDRDRYVTVDQIAVCQDGVGGFGDLIPVCDPGANYGPFDYASVMLYSSDFPSNCVKNQSCVLLGHTAGGATSPILTGKLAVSDGDASAILERYAEQSGWTRFAPVYRRDPGASQPLDMNLAAGVRMVGSPALGVAGGQTVWVVARGSNTYYVKSWAHTSLPKPGDFTAIPGSWKSDPAINGRSDGVLTIAGVGTNDAVWYVHRIGGIWGTPKSLGRPVGGQAASAPAVVWHDGYLSVLVISGGKLYERQWSPATQVWEPSWRPLATGFKGRPAAVSWGPKRIDVVLVGLDDTVKHLEQVDLNWRSIEPLGGAVRAGTSPIVTSGGINHLNIYVTGKDNGRLHAKHWDGGWSNWHDDYGGLPEGSPAAVMTPDGHEHQAIHWTGGQGLFHRMW